MSKSAGGARNPRISLPPSTPPSKPRACHWTSGEVSDGPLCFDVYANTGTHTPTTPYLREVQGQLLDGLNSRVVVQGEACSLETPKMAAVPLRVLKSPVASLTDRQSDHGSVGFLFQRYCAVGVTFDSVHSPMPSDHRCASVWVVDDFIGPFRKPFAFGEFVHCPEKPAGTRVLSEGSH